jgi:hypothetical protein
MVSEELSSGPDLGFPPIGRLHIVAVSADDAASARAQYCLLLLFGPLLLLVEPSCCIFDRIDQTQRQTYQSTIPSVSGTSPGLLG